MFDMTSYIRSRNVYTGASIAGNAGSYTYEPSYGSDGVSTISNNSAINAIRESFMEKIRKEHKDSSLFDSNNPNSLDRADRTDRSDSLSSKKSAASRGRDIVEIDAEDTVMPKKESIRFFTPAQVVTEIRQPGEIDRKKDDKLPTCNHDMNSPDTTLKLLPMRRMVIPAQSFCKCEECKKLFSFVKINGEYRETGKEERFIK